MPRRIQTLDVRQNRHTDVLVMVEQRLGVALDRASQVYGIDGATSGLRTHRGTWVRLQHRPAGLSDKWAAWTAEETASALHGVVKPAWFQAASWFDDKREVLWRADELELISSPTLGDRAAGPKAECPDWWWERMKSSLAALQHHDTERVAVSQATVSRRITESFGNQVDTTIEEWAAAHGDIHWGNLTADGHLLDWEGWGQAPRGFDAACLWGLALPTPKVAARIHREFREDLGSSSGTLARLMWCATAIRAAQKRPNLHHILPLVHAAAQALLAEFSG